MGCFVALCVCSLFAAFSMKRSKAAHQHLLQSFRRQSTELDELLSKYNEVCAERHRLSNLLRAREDSYIRALEGERAKVKDARSALQIESGKNSALAEELAKLREDSNSLEFQRNQLIARNAVLEQSYHTMQCVTIPDIEEYVAKLKSQINELNRTSFKNLVHFMWENVQLIKCAVVRVRPNTDEEQRKLGDEVMGRERDIEEQMKAQGVFGMDV